MNRPRHLAQVLPRPEVMALAAEEPEVWAELVQAIGGFVPGSERDHSGGDWDGSPAAAADSPAWSRRGRKRRRGPKGRGGGRA